MTCVLKRLIYGSDKVEEMGAPSHSNFVCQVNGFCVGRAHTGCWFFEVTLTPYTQKTQDFTSNFEKKKAGRVRGLAYTRSIFSWRSCICLSCNYCPDVVITEAPIKIMDRCHELLAFHRPLRGREARGAGAAIVSSLLVIASRLKLRSPINFGSSSTHTGDDCVKSMGMLPSLWDLHFVFFGTVALAFF